MPDRLKVLFHVDSLAIGGLEKKVTQLVLSMDRSRFEPVLSYSAEWGPNGEELRRANIPVEFITPGTPGRPDAHAAVNRIRELAPAIFHTFSCRRNAYDVWAAREAGVPVILSSRSNTRYWSPEDPVLNWEVDRNAMTHIVVACSEAAARIVREIEGVHPEKIAVIYNGVAIPELANRRDLRRELGIPEGALLAGYAAKYRPLKAHENLLLSWREVIRARPDAFLVCCGEDDQGRQARLQELAQRLGLEQRVFLLPACQDMESFYRSLDLYVHPSSTEGFSNAILEAMSYGLPVVAGAVGGNVEAIEDGVSGVLTSLQPDQFGAAVARLAADEPMRHALGCRARKRVCDRFSLLRMTSEYEALYLRAAATRLAQNLTPPACPEFTGGAAAPCLDDVTVFVTTIGDALNFEDCIAHLEAQTVRCRIELIDRVAPLSAAFSLMHERCKTPYYVQVDEDMLLYPSALETLRERIVESAASVPLVCAPLWDCDVERPILGVKIYRHEIVKRFPYRNSLSCEITQLRSMNEAGHYAVDLPAEPHEAVCLGEHGKHYTPQTIFVRWQRLFHKRNELGHLDWIAVWPARLLERYEKTGDPLHLYAALGAIAGITGRAERNREMDWRDTNAGLQRLFHYFPVK